MCEKEHRPLCGFEIGLGGLNKLGLSLFGPWLGFSLIKWLYEREKVQMSVHVAKLIFLVFYLCHKIILEFIYIQRFL